MNNRLRTAVFAGLAAAGLLQFFTPLPAQSTGRLSLGRFLGNRQSDAKAADTRSRTAQKTKPVKLHYFFGASWPHVLQDVAKATDSTLVMDQAPTNRFVRRDKTSYTRAEAVRILNQQLERQGFRLLEKGEFLVVMRLKDTRARYKRPVLPSNKNSARATTPNTALSESAIRRLDYQVEADQNSATKRSASKQPSIAVVKLRRHAAADVARVIYSAHKPHAELLKNGPNGLPAFRVFRPSTTATGNKVSRRDASGEPRTLNNTDFTIGIDAKRDELAIQASAGRIRQLTVLVQQLDAIDLAPDESVQLLTDGSDSQRIVQKLRPHLKRLVVQPQRGNNSTRARPTRTGGAFADGLVAANGVNQPPPARPEPKQSGQQPQPPGAIIDPILGDVEIQVVPGGIIVRGNKNDIDAVMKIVRQIQEFSRGTVSEIHLLLLLHVNSEALAALLGDVYEQLNALRARGNNLPETIAFVPVVVPNAILILAPRVDMERILDTAEKLDQPVDPRTEIEVFPLRHAIATQIVTAINDFFPQQEQQAGLQPRVFALADVRTNSIIVRARPNDLNQVALIIRKIDLDQSGAVNQVRMFELKNAVAEELAVVVNTAIQSVLNPPSTTGAGGLGQIAGNVGAGGQAAQQLRDAKSVVLELLSAEAGASQVIRSGILADIRVTADARSNKLVVTAPQQSMLLMAELIRQLDQPTSNVAEIKVFTLENSDATAMAQLLESLFPAQDQGQNQSGVGIQVVGAEDAASSLIPLRFSVDPRTNTLIAVGGAEALRVVEAILLRLDESDLRQRQSTVIRLKNSPVSEVADAINQFLTSQRELANVDPNLVSNVEVLEREVIVVPEAVSNSLLISATPRYYDEIMQIVADLDKAPAQVIIQALLVEVELDNTDEFGIELGFQDSLLFDRSITLAEDLLTIPITTTAPNGVQTTNTNVISQASTPGFLFNNQPLGNNVQTARSATLGRQGLSNFSLGRINGDLGFGGLVMSASSESISMLIRALASQRNVNILSRPQIRTVDNQFSSIQVGQIVPIINGFTPATQTSGPTPIPQQVEVGIILQVTPRISPDGMIVMETIATKSAVSGQGLPLVTDALTGNVIESPIIDITTVQTTVSVPDGQTVVMGGMITKREESITRKVPWLGEIPILGKAFRFDSTTMRRTELLIFLTPRIVRNDQDSELIKQIEIERMHFVTEDAEEIHGPLFGIPAGDDGRSVQPMNGTGNQQPPAPAPAVSDDEDIPTTKMPNVPYQRSANGELPGLLRPNLN